MNDLESKRQALRKVEIDMIKNIKKQIGIMHWYNKQPAKNSKTISKRAFTVMKNVCQFAILKNQYNTIRSQPIRKFPSGGITAECGEIIQLNRTPIADRIVQEVKR